MEKKSLLGFLDEVSKERGFDKFSHSTDVGKVYVVEGIIKEAGKRYVKQYLDIAAENSSIHIEGADYIGQVREFNINSDNVVLASGHINTESITNIEIDV